MFSTCVQTLLVEGVIDLRKPRELGRNSTIDIAPFPAGHLFLPRLLFLNSSGEKAPDIRKSCQTVQFQIKIINICFYPQVIFSSRGSYVQTLLVEELVAATDALSREAASEALRLLLGSPPAALALNTLRALGPLRTFVVPLPTPIEIMSRRGAGCCLCVCVVLWELRVMNAVHAILRHAMCPVACLRVVEWRGAMLACLSAPTVT